MTTNASEAVYRGREGSGEAQILQGNAGLAQLMRQQQYRQQQAMYQQRLGYQMQQMRNQRDNQLMKSDFSKPGTFQQEQSMKEIGEVSDYTRRLAQENPYASRLDIENAVSEKKNQVQTRIARRNEVQEALKGHTSTLKKDFKRFDPDAVQILHDYVLSDVDHEKGRVAPKDIEKIDPSAVESMLEHPSVINPHTAIVDAVAPIKQQLQFSEPGKVVNTGLGLMQVDETGKARFVKADGTPGIDAHHVEYVLEKNPAIENKFFWEIAQQNVATAGGDPRDLEQVQGVYDQIRHTDDPSVLRQVYDKTKKDLEQLQSVSSGTKYTNLGKFSETQKVAPSPEDYNITRDQVNSIATAFDKGDVTNINDLLKNLENKKYNGMFIMEAKPAIETDAKGPDKKRIKLTLKVGTAGGYAFRTDANGNVQTNEKGLPLLDYNTPTKANATETIYLDPKNKSALFDLLKYNHPEKKAKQMGYNQSGLTDQPSEPEIKLDLTK